MTHTPHLLEQALHHLEQAIHSEHIASAAAKGLIYSVLETLGVLVGDPALPDQLRDAYGGLQEKARALKEQIENSASRT